MPDSTPLNNPSAFAIVKALVNSDNEYIYPITVITAVKDLATGKYLNEILEELSGTDTGGITQEELTTLIESAITNNTTIVRYGANNKIAETDLPELDYIKTTEKGTANGVATLDDNLKILKDQIPAELSSPMTTISESTILNISHAGSFIKCTNTSPIIITVPVSIFTLGTEIEIMQEDTGSITISGESGVTLHNCDSVYSLNSQYSYCKLKQINDNEWLLTGALK